MLEVSFHGAAREVTGSCHLIRTDRSRVLLDCGMIQGGKERHERNREAFPFRASELDAVVLSHAHIDHSGRLPLLVKAGFSGRIYCTRATAKLAQILLLDSAKIHEEDARWKIKRLRKRGKDTSWVEPLYTEEDAAAAIERLHPVDFDTPSRVTDDLELEYAMAGHILGAGIVQLRASHDGKSRSVTFSGDLGVDGARLVGKPSTVRAPDFLLIESTYGDRRRTVNRDRTDELYDVVARTVKRKGKVIIPAFAVGRTQDVVARLNDLVESGRLEGLSVYVDSPMAVRATGVFTQNRDAYSKEAQRKAAWDRPLEFPGLHLVRSVDESIALNKMDGPAVIISASGMCTAGRIKHHLKHNIQNRRNTILFVGYQAHGSLGRIIKQGTSPVRIFGDWYDVRAEIASIDGFSAHADLDELLEWYGALGRTPRRTFVVHGEERAALSFAERLRERFDADVTVPRLGERFELR